MSTSYLGVSGRICWGSKAQQRTSSDDEPLGSVVIGGEVFDFGFDPTRLWAWMRRATTTGRRKWAMSISYKLFKKDGDETMWAEWPNGDQLQLKGVSTDYYDELVSKRTVVTTSFVWEGAIEQDDVRL